MSKMSKDKRDKLILVIIAGVGVVSVLYFLVITDQKDELNSLGLKVDALRAKIVSSEKTHKRQVAVQENLDLQRKILTEKQEEMPRPGQDQRWFLNMMEDRRNRFGLEFGDYKSPDIIYPGILPEFEFSAISFPVIWLGAYADFGRFLADFENSFPYMRVELTSISVEPRLATGGLEPLGQASKTSAAPAEPWKLRFTFRVVSLIKTPT